MQANLILLLCIMGINAMRAQPWIEIHGHRGDRYWMPENSVEAFYDALLIGAKWIELDVVSTKDGHLVINHDPVLKKSIFSDAPRKSILQLSLQELQGATWGMKEQKKFPFQQRKTCTLHTLEEAVLSIEDKARNSGLPLPFWNIEVKSLPHRKKWYPDRKSYAQQVVHTIQKLPIQKRYFVQSFDAKLLKEIHALAPEMPLYYLVIKPREPEKIIKKLGFRPVGINPYYKFAKKSFIDAAHDDGLRVIVWTVNNPAAILTMKELQVDGIISDVPDWVKYMLTEDPANYETLQDPLNFSEQFLHTVQEQGFINLFILKLAIAKHIPLKPEEQMLFEQNIYEAFHTILTQRNPEQTKNNSLFKRKIIPIQQGKYSLKDLQKDGFMDKILSGK